MPLSARKGGVARTIAGTATPVRRAAAGYLVTMNLTTAKKPYILTRRLSAWLTLGFVIAALSFGFAQEDEAHENVEAYEKTHWLEGRTLCVAPDSILLTFNDVTPTRAEAAQANTFSSLKGNLKNTLRKADVKTEFGKSCQDSDSFVLVHIRIAFLDPNVYPSNRYGEQAFGLTLSVHAGRHADATYLADHYVLPEQRFITFDELAFSEVDRGEGFERYVKERAGAMITELAEAWHEDNP